MIKASSVFLISRLVGGSVVVIEACERADVLEIKFKSIEADLTNLTTQLEFQKSLLTRSSGRLNCLTEFRTFVYELDWVITDRDIPFPNSEELPSVGQTIKETLFKAEADDVPCSEALKSAGSDLIKIYGAPFVVRAVELKVREEEKIIDSIRDDINQFESKPVLMNGKNLKLDFVEATEECIIELNEKDAEISNYIRYYEDQINQVYLRADYIYSIIQNQTSEFQPNSYWGYQCFFPIGSFSHLFEEMFFQDSSSEIADMFMSVIKNLTNEYVAWECILEFMYADFIRYQESLIEPLQSELTILNEQAEFVLKKKNQIAQLP